MVPFLGPGSRTGMGATPGKSLLPVPWASIPVVGGSAARSTPSLILVIVVSAGPSPVSSVRRSSAATPFALLSPHLVRRFSVSLGEFYLQLASEKADSVEFGEGFLGVTDVFELDVGESSWASVVVVQGDVDVGDGAILAEQAPELFRASAVGYVPHEQGRVRGPGVARHGCRVRPTKFWG